MALHKRGLTLTPPRLSVGEKNEKSMKKSTQAAKDQVSELMSLHYEIRGHLENKRFDDVLSIISNSVQKIDVNELKTIEIILRPFKESPELRDGYATVVRVMNAGLEHFELLMNRHNQRVDNSK